MKKIVKKRKKKIKVKKYSSKTTHFYLHIIIFASLLSSIATFLIVYSKITSENVLAAQIQKIQNYPENNILTQNNSDVMYHGDRTEKKVALTFDADMTPFMKEQILLKNAPQSINNQLLEYLEKTQTPATLFLTGLWIELYPDAAKKLAGDPLFELGNHSYSHPSFAGYCFGLPRIKDSDAVAEIGVTQKLLKDLTGFDNMLFRFPGGCFDSQDLTLVKEAGLKVVHWDVAGEDGFNFNVESIENNVLKNVQNGSIIVLHMNGYPTAPRTADAVPVIVEELKKRGFEFVTVSQLLNL